MNYKQLKKATKKQLLNYLIELHGQFRGYATIIEDEDEFEIPEEA